MPSLGTCKLLQHFPYFRHVLRVVVYGRDETTVDVGKLTPELRLIPIIFCLASLRFEVLHMLYLLRSVFLRLWKLCC